MRTENGDWTSQPDKRQKRVAQAQRGRRGCEGIQCPAASDQKTHTRTDRNSMFHQACSVCQPNHLTCSRKQPQENSRHARAPANPLALTICPRSARILKALRKGELVVSPSWACGAAGSALPWHGRGRRFDPDQVHQILPSRSLSRPGAAAPPQCRAVLRVLTRFLP